MEGIVLGILGIEGMLGNGGRVGIFGILGIVVGFGSGGNVGFGSGGNVGFGNVGCCGIPGTEGRGGNVGNCNRLRAASPSLMEANAKATKKANMKQLLEAILGLC
ncbi:hypothetical protein AB3S75_041261 [Citrus x aurantiifolia]